MTRQSKRLAVAAAALLTALSLGMAGCSDDGANTRSGNSSGSTPGSGSGSGSGSH